METEIRELFDEKILNEAGKRFGIEVSRLTFLGGFQNFIYEYKAQDKYYILRITYSLHRKEEQVKGELDWILYLADRGVSASKPVCSQQGKLTERIEVTDSYFIAVLFEKAVGRRVVYPECISNDYLFEKCGEITGRIHFLSKQYTPSINEIRRHEWTDNYYLKNFDKFIPAEKKEIHESCRYLIKEINKLGKDSDSYGLIHGDINVFNFLVDDSVINIFDFDECQYSWFVEDIAIQLFYIVYVFLDDSIEERQEQADRFMKSFMQGYVRENHLEEYWLSQIPLFLKLRELIVHVGMYRSWDFSDLNQWCRSYIAESGQRIEKGIPIVNITSQGDKRNNE